jgi:hypothetical protein
MSASDREEIEATKLTGRILGDAFILVRWDSVYQGRRSRRTSL